MDMKKLRRKMRRWIRKHRLFLILACAAALLAALLLMIPSEEPETTRDYEGFLNALGFRESSNRYDIVNRFGYMGRYQMGELALQEAGMMDADGAWTALANSYGIYSREDFLDSPEVQDMAVRAYHKKTWAYIEWMELDAYVGSTYCGVTVTESGLLAACHLVGVGGVKRGLQNGQHVYDANRVSAAEYMELFAGFDISGLWTEQEG